MTGPLVLVTGAGGFIGGWMAEALHLQRWGRVRAGVNRWSAAARIARIPLDIVLCDVMNADSLDAALRDVEVVIHCARGEENGVTEGGTRLLLERAARAGVRHIVYLSTVAVYGEAGGVVVEDTAPVAPVTSYGAGKLKAEATCQAFAGEPMSISVIRPTLVYGPFSEQWTVPYLARFASGKWRRLGAGGEGKCNLVYVGDLVRQAQFLVEAGLGPYVVFNGNGPDIPTWNTYIETFNEMLGYPPLADADPNLPLTVALNRPVRELGKYAMAHHRDLVLAVANRSPKLKSMMRQLETNLRLQATRDEVTRFSTDVTYSMDRAAAAGFRPKTTLHEGLAMTADWARHMGLAR